MDGFNSGICTVEERISEQENSSVHNEGQWDTKMENTKQTVGYREYSDKV